MNRTASAPSPLVKGGSVKGSPSVTSAKFQTTLTRKLAGAGPLGRAGGSLVLPSSIDGAYLLEGPGVRARLPHFAPPDLWSKHSTKHIVRELYAGYAADPLAPGPRIPLGSSPSSSSGGTPRFLTEITDSSNVPFSRPCFLERYVRQQAHIEKMLNEWQPPSAEVDESAEAKMLEIMKNLANEEADEMDEDGQPMQAVDMFMPPAEELWPLQVTAKTRNVVLNGSQLTCSLKSGGARFSAPDTHSFRFCVRPLDPPETHPIYIGMVPAGHEVRECDFFDRSEGIFLRVGGYPAGRENMEEPLDENFPLRPEFQVFGERVPADMPLPNPGRAVALHLFESYPRKIHITEKIQCTDCKLLVDTVNEFTDHAFDSTDECGEPDESHGRDFGFDCCQHVEIVEEGDYNVDPHLRHMHVRGQTENALGRGKKAPNAVCHGHNIRNGVPELPRELPELVGGKTEFGPPGPWELCVFLCVPGSRVEVSWLQAGRPLKKPNPTFIRPAAAAKVEVEIEGLKA